MGRTTKSARYSPSLSKSQRSALGRYIVDRDERLFEKAARGECAIVIGRDTVVRAVFDSIVDGDGHALSLSCGREVYEPLPRPEFN